MRLTAGPGTMSSGSANFLLVPIPEFPLPDSAPARTVKIAVLGASNVGKTGTRAGSDQQVSETLGHAVLRHFHLKYRRFFFLSFFFCFCFVFARTPPSAGGDKELLSWPTHL